MDRRKENPLRETWKTFKIHRVGHVGAILAPRGKKLRVS